MSISFISSPRLHTVCRWSPRSAREYTGLLAPRGIVIDDIVRRMIRRLCDEADHRQVELAMGSSPHINLRVLPIAEMPAHRDDGVEASGLYDYAPAIFPVSLVHPFLVLEMLVCRTELMPRGRIYAAMDPIAIGGSDDFILAIDRKKDETHLEGVNPVVGDLKGWNKGHYATNGAPGSPVKWQANSSWLFAVRE